MEIDQDAVWEITRAIVKALRPFRLRCKVAEVELALAGAHTRLVIKAVKENPEYMRIADMDEEG